MSQPELNTSLVEYDGDLPSFVKSLSYLAWGYPKLYPPEHDPWWFSHQVQEHLQDAIRVLNLKSPKGYYFGGHKYDPTSFGFWQVDENERKTNVEPC